MKYQLLLLSVFTALNFSTFAQETVDSDETKSAAEISFTEKVHDFGEIEEGPKVSHQFNFTNSGTAALVLSDVKASCGCTVPEWPKEPILPGEEAAIDVTYNTKGRPGNFNKAITITSNAKESKKVLYIKGKVMKATQPPLRPEKEKSTGTPGK